jgi:hypothetical protein
MNRISSVDAPIRLIRIFKEQDAGQSTSAHGLLIETWPARAPNWFDQKRRVVEPDGIEPTTSCLQSRRSPN